MPLCLCTTQWRNGWYRKKQQFEIQIWKLSIYLSQQITELRSRNIPCSVTIDKTVFTWKRAYVLHFICHFFSLCFCLFLYLVAALVKNPTVLRLSKKQTPNKCECVKLSTVEVSSYTAVWIIPFNWDITHSLRFTITAYRLRFDYASNVGFILTAMRMFSFRNRCLSMGLTLEKFII